MIHRFNSPHAQVGPIAFLVVGLIGSANAIRGMMTPAVGNEPWSVGILVQVIVLVGFAVIIGGWLWVQREVSIGDGSIITNRWLWRLLGSPACRITR